MRPEYKERPLTLFGNDLRNLRKAIKKYQGQDLTITFDMKRCIHARNCFLKLPKVFDPAQRPWVQPDNAATEEITAMIRT